MKLHVAFWLLPILISAFVYHIVDINDSAEINNICEGTGSPIPSQNTIEESETSVSINNEQVYDGFIDIPYDKMRFSNDYIFNFLKDAYERIDFYGEFKKGDIEKYDFFKSKYYKLINNEEMITDKKTGEEYYLKEISEFNLANNSNETLFSNYTFYFFDMDEDNSPELCINTYSSIFVFKYILESNKYILWNNLSSYQLLGSKKIMWIHLGSGIGHVFYKLNNNGENDFSIFVYIAGKYKEPIYVATLPLYEDESKIIEIPDNIKYYVYRDKDLKCYFRLTEHQYYELTRDLMDSEKIAKEKIKEVTFTYSELFENP